MNWSNRNVQKLEGKCPLYRRAKFDTRRKYSGICMSMKFIGDSRKCSKNTDLFGWMSEMQASIDQFGDGCHKSIIISNTFEIRLILSLCLMRACTTGLTGQLLLDQMIYVGLLASFICFSIPYSP